MCFFQKRQGFSHAKKKEFLINVEKFLKVSLKNIGNSQWSQGFVITAATLC